MMMANLPEKPKIAQTVLLAEGTRSYSSLIFQCTAEPIQANKERHMRF